MMLCYYAMPACYAIMICYYDMLVLIVTLFQVKDYRLTLNFMLQVMEAIILVQTKMFLEYYSSNHEDLPDAIQKLGEIDWKNTEDKQKLGKKTVDLKANV